MSAGKRQVRPVLTREQKRALVLVAKEAGYAWKQKLCLAWAAPIWPFAPELETPLRQVRNSFGPTWLLRTFKLSDAESRFVWVIITPTRVRLFASANYANAVFSRGRRMGARNWEITKDTVRDAGGDRGASCDDCGVIDETTPVVRDGSAHSVCGVCVPGGAS